MKAIIPIAAVALILCSGCYEDRPTRKDVERVNAELAYMRGWSQGFDICKDIQNGKIPDRDAGLERFNSERQQFLDSLKH